MTTPTKAAELAEKLAEFNRYFTSANGVDVGERVSVPRDEWRTLYALLRASEGRVPDAVFASGAYDAAVDDFENDQGDIPAEKIKQFVQRLFAAAPHPPAQQAWCWVISGSEQIWRGPDAQEDAEREARRVGGSCRAFALYASPPPHKAEGAEPAGEKFFSYGGDIGFEEFATAEEAKHAANEQITAYRQDADREWPDEVESVCWGVIVERAQAVSEAGSDPELEGCDYLLKPATQEPSA